MFRLTGYKRYSFWLHKLLKELSGAHQQDLHQAVMEWEKKEEHRDQYAWGLVTDIYRGITNSRTSCEYMKCWALAGRFPVQDFKLVKGVESAGTLMVDKEHSKDFLVGLKAQMDRVFVYEEGKSASTHVKAFAWWK